MKDQRIALWPPMMSTRERLRFSEAAAGLRNRDGIEALSSYAPLADRYWALTTYGKGAFELAVRNSGLAGSRMVVPAFIAHDFVGVFSKYDITPVFVDVDPVSFQVRPDLCDPEVLAAASSLILLHTFGLPADGAGMRTLCDEHNLVMIEDCARALGGRVDDKPVGWHGDYAIFSLSKVAPVRRGGVLVSRSDLDVTLDQGRAGVSGLVNSLLLLKVPGLKALEGPMYRLLRESPAYPGEIGLYSPPEIERPERVVEFFLNAFLPHYGEVLKAKRDRALAIRRRLEPMGFQFQADPGNHIYTALGALVPPEVDKIALQSHLKRRAINSYTLWGDPLGTSQVAKDAWGTDPTEFPVAADLAQRLIHFPVGRFLNDREIDRLVAACEEFVDGSAVAGG